MWMSEELEGTVFVPLRAVQGLVIRPGFRGEARKEAI